VGNLFTAPLGNILTVLLGNVLTAGVGKVLDIYSCREIQGEVPPENVIALFDTAYESEFYN
jgi:hypothetical protein